VTSYSLILNLSSSKQSEQLIESKDLRHSMEDRRLIPEQ